jgi:ubiquinone/menaquinone biosynthesis C-methylase UbiE
MKEKGKANEIRQEVSINYARAVTEGRGCCGGTSSCCSSAGTGYSDEDILDLISSSDLVSFGCGNPLAFGAVQEGDTVLDLGSGAGLDLLIAARKTGPSGRVIGIDMTDEMIAIARKNIARAGMDNVEVRKGIIEDLPVDSESVDWVISNCVINLSPEKERVFQEIYRVLKPGGQMIVSDVVAEDLPDWMRESSSLYSGCIAGAISEGEYIRGLQKEGLENVEVRDRAEYGIHDIRTFIMDSAEIPLQVFEEFHMDREKVADHYAETLSGKIFSLQFYARKPERL